MGRLTTHVLDTMNGCPASGMTLSLYHLTGERAELLRSGISLNQDGRVDSPLLEHDALQRGHYRLVFDVAVYFRDRGVALPDPPFLDRVPLDVGISDPSLAWHVPLLVSPWAFSSYRGS